MQRTLIATIAAGAIALAGIAQASAEEGVSPGGGPAFGQHVSGMAPEHPKGHGRMFGQCVSAMARTGQCPHHE